MAATLRVAGARVLNKIVIRRSAQTAGQGRRRRPVVGGSTGSAIGRSARRVLTFAITGALAGYSVRRWWNVEPGSHGVASATLGP
jgi:hypothetical protein